MPYYHDSKEAALSAGKPYEGHWHIRASLEPYNGWVLTLQPRSVQVFDWPLAPLLAVAELDLTGFTRMRQRPAEHRTAPPAKVVSARVAPSGAPKVEVVKLEGEQRIKPAWMK